ncbi:MAG: heat-inducible transcription repressor HrcA [Lachnospiraceae bacterium]|nr:heat-inducible transcription repressor HrcA [Lachnospiraceae bacterium]MBO4669118.1 heat-inducible transcription repressor HrcA [Lachnospiraceae bacterium]MBR5666758.1 heat-inducible transcription repressor HrcA [Lachnospiraceae bacterium]
MELDDRKLKILTAIIRNYLETGEPVGSRTISKDSDLNLSSATIRNEMSDLEEMGLIVQPHTSAGRIPSDKGYRLYVDMMLKEKEEELNNLKVELNAKSEKLDTILKEAAKVIADSTNYASMITVPQYRSKKIKFIQLTQVDYSSILCVVVLDGNIIKNMMVPCDRELPQDAILKLNLMMNTFLQGLDMQEINVSVMQKLRTEASEYSALISDILDAVAKCLEEQGVEAYTSGSTNIFKYPELNESGKATNLLYALEEKKQLTELMYKEGDKDRGIQVYIGEENPIEATKDCTLVTATYHLEDGVYGKIGILGPRRMDYEKVVGTLRNLMSELDGIFHKE